MSDSFGSLSVFCYFRAVWSFLLDSCWQVIREDLENFCYCILFICMTFNFGFNIKNF